MLKQTFSWYLASLCVMVIGGLIAARYYPAGFDWSYTVASALMSQKHNPAGSFWFAASLSLSMLLLWPYVSYLQQSLSHSRLVIMALRIGLVCGMLLGVERLLIYDLSHWLNKGHEALALLSFIGLYFGILGLLVLSLLQQSRFRIPVMLVAVALIGISVSLLWLYLTQRHLGWVDASWREKGIPIWLSFAFWQWWMIALLWLGLGVLNWVKK